MCGWVGRGRGDDDYKDKNLNWDEDDGMCKNRDL